MNGSCAYLSPSAYTLVYCYTLPGSPDHAGLVKVGDTTLRSPLASADLPPNCPALLEQARKRIAQQTNTAGLAYDLLHAELAVRPKLPSKKGERVLVPFQDHDVHDVLENSGFRHVKMSGTTAREWFRADLATIRRAIAATKENRFALDSSELRPSNEKIVFRAEQEAAIAQTLKRFKRHPDMLWDAKMRFGKTATALEVVRRSGYRKTIIVTHRPVVGSGWESDFHKIFDGGEKPFAFLDHTKAVRSGEEAREEAAKRDLLRRHDRAGKPFVYFASLQDLRGSRRISPDGIPKNEAVFDTDWDLVIVDEAHEGTQTDLGRKVVETLVKPGRTKVLSLSGTPFNIRSQYDPEAVFVWDYTQEQTAKRDWPERHPDEPNHYAALPRMNIFTFDLAAEFRAFAEEELAGKAFNFAEFFRTDPKGAFVHAKDVERFLDLLSAPSDTSAYPFSTAAFCDFFRHTLWMVPGVAAAKALGDLLRIHPKFKTFKVANVAGEGDDYEETHAEDALTLVRETIRANPRTITLSCGRLTMGVTVPEWTAVMMLAGSANTSAASYMQTIFRVQSPWLHDGQMKEECYVFDFAPDRTLTVLTDAVCVSRRETKTETRNRDEQNRAALGEFLNFCPVIAMEGGRARRYDARDLMQRVKRVFVLRAIRNGFDDPCLYSDRLLALSNLDLQKFEHLKGIVGASKPTEAPKGVLVNDQGFSDEEWERLKREAKKKGRELSDEDRKRLEELRKAREERRNAISILRAISIRMPLLIYGAEGNFDEKITLERFVELVDEASWAEFMPRGVSKRDFLDFVEYYDRDVFEAAGLAYRRIAKQADALRPGERVREIAALFASFRNPDKETVLTPWNVVSRHLGDTLGGWRFDGENPRFEDRGEVTRRVFSPAARILEINSKSGLYPLYVAYSIYRRKLGELEESEVATAALCWKRWNEAVAESVFVLCKTPMARSITRRTLLGYRAGTVNAVCWKGDLVATLKDRPQDFIETVKQGRFWNRKEKNMEFDAVVGNPPYQMEIAKKQSETNGQARRKSIFQYFQYAADLLATQYVSLIYPGIRWMHRSGKGMEEFGLYQINDPHLAKLDFYPNAEDVFTSVAIADGITIVFKDMTKATAGFTYVYHTEGGASSCILPNPGEELMALDPCDGTVLAKVGRVMEARGLSPLWGKLLSQKFFDLESDFVEKNPKSVKPYDGKAPLGEGEIKILTNDRAGKAGRAHWYVGKRDIVAKEKQKYIDEWQVVVSSANAGGQKRDWQLAIMDNHTAFGRVRVGLSSFKTKAEAEHFHAYCQTYLVRFLFLKTDEALTSLAKKVPDFGDYRKENGVLDFSRDLNTQLYALFGLTKPEIAHVEKTIKDIDSSRRKAKPME